MKQADAALENIADTDLAWPLLAHAMLTSGDHVDQPGCYKFMSPPHAHAVT